jgi:FkbM family methyltransferase
MRRIWLHPMARGSRVRAVARAASWEVSRRVLQRDRLVELPGGGMMVCPAWDGASRRVVAVGLHDYGEQTFVLRVLRPGDIVLDVGAYFGSYTALTASCGAVVHAFEPAERAGAVLRRTIAANGGSDRLHVHALALSDFAGTSYLTDGLASGNHLLAGSDAADLSAVPVPVQTLDGWAGDNGVTDPWLLKVDAEGQDEAVLRGGSSLLREAQPALIVEYWNGGAGLCTQLADFGYQTFRFDVDRNKLMPFHAHSGDGNLIACTPRRLDRVRQRLEGQQPGRRPARPPAQSGG